MMLKQDGAFQAGNERFEGFLADILLRLTASIGVNYEIRLCRDGKYGEPVFDKYWNGMIGEVQRMVG